MQFDTLTTGVAFVIVIALAAAGMIVSNMMVTDTILTMVVPSMVIFGLIMLALGVKHGEFRAAG